MYWGWYSAKKNSKRTKGWASWVFSIKIKILLSPMPSHLTKSTPTWKINSHSSSIQLKLTTSNLMIKILLSKLNGIWLKNYHSRKNKKILNIKSMLTKFLEIQGKKWMSSWKGWKNWDKIIGGILITTTESCMNGRISPWKQKQKILWKESMKTLKDNLLNWDKDMHKKLHKVWNPIKTK